MKKGEIYQGIVERIDYPNKGLVMGEEGKCMVKNALPGQEISFRVTKLRKGKAEGLLKDILKKAPQEQEVCPHFGECGGCTYISLPYEEQLAIKEGQVKRLLEPALARQSANWEWEGILPSPKIFAYRNKMEFSFGDEYKDGPLSLGMHKRGSFYDVVCVENCQIVDADYRKILSATRGYWEKLQIPFYHRMRKEGYLRHLLVRKASGTGEILVALVTTSQIDNREESLLQGWKECLSELSLDGKFAGILHIQNDSDADVVQSDKTTILEGKDYFEEKLLGLTFRVSLFSFFQTNSFSAEVLYQKAREYMTSVMGKMGTLYDLYSGTGTIAQMMAPVANKVYGVEIVEEAVVAARENAAVNGLSNCEFIAGDVLKVLDGLTEKPDMIILDPPRDGVHPKALPKIISYGVPYLVYISCKPTSLARDLEIFVENGYQVEKACCVDQFPWTANIETVVLLSKKHVNPKAYVEIGVDAEEYYKIKGEKH